MKKQRFLYVLLGIGAAFFAMGLLVMMLLPFARSLQEASSVSEIKAVGDDAWLTAVTEQLKEQEYNVSAVESQAVVYQAPNRAQNLRTVFSETGIQVEPRVRQGQPWQVGLDIAGISNGVQSLRPQLETHTTTDNRLTMDYGQWQAWYVNDVRGVQQGFTIDEPLFAEETGLLLVDMAVTGDLALQWIDDDEIQMVTAVGKHVLTYRELVAFDAQGNTLPAAMELIDISPEQQGIRLAVNTADAAYPIVIDPFLGGGVDWEAWTDQDANFGFSVSSAGDVNQDGFDDVLVGAHWYDGGFPNSGAVFAYYGGPVGLLPVHQWMFLGSVLDMELGYAVNAAGDVNGDGFDDVIIGTHMTPTGQAFVFQGSPVGLDLAPLWIGSGEQQLGDGFGMAVNTAGDVDGDELDDIIIGAPYFDIPGHFVPDGGRVYVFSGADVSAGINDPAAAWRAQNSEIGSSSAFGYSVGTAGDVDGNGFDDVIIGAPFYFDGEVETGYAGIFSGTLEGLPGGWGTITNTVAADWNSYAFFYPNAQYGFSVGTAGDVNQDGFDDVIVGAPLLTYIGMNEGAAFVFTGTNPINNMDSLVEVYSPWYFGSSVDFALFGYSVSTAGDVDQDGYDDVIVGSPHFDNGVLGPQGTTAVNGGGAFVLRGSPFGFADIWEFSSNTSDAKLGTSVDTAGDVNGDGYADVIVGAPMMPSPGGTLGEAFSIYGSGEIRGLQAYNDSPSSFGRTTLLWTEVMTGGELYYAWSLGDGTFAEGAVVEHVYPAPGYYTAIVTGTSWTDMMTATTAVTISQRSLIDPANGGSLTFLNEETGFGIGVQVPPGAVSETVQLSFTPLVTIPQRPPDNSLGYYFDLNADMSQYQVFLPIVVNGDLGGTTTGVETAVVNSLGEDTGTDSIYFAVPVTVTIIYSDTGLTLPEEESLKLLYWDFDGTSPAWIDIAEECGLEGTYVYYPDDNYFTVQVCHLSQFGVAH